MVTANGEVQTREEATVYVKQLDLFVKVMLLEEIPAVLSLEKLCCGSWFISEFFLNNHLHLLLPSSSSQDSVFDVNRYMENPVPERSGSTSGELRGDPLHETT